MKTIQRLALILIVAVSTILIQRNLPVSWLMHVYGSLRYGRQLSFHSVRIHLPMRWSIKELSQGTIVLTEANSWGDTDVGNAILVLIETRMLRTIEGSPALPEQIDIEGVIAQRKQSSVEEKAGTKVFFAAYSIDANERHARGALYWAIPEHCLVISAPDLALIHKQDVLDLMNKITFIRPEPWCEELTGSVSQ